MNLKRVGLLTAGGLAPCLSSSVGFLIEKYTKHNPEIEIICYRSGYKGLLLGDHFVVDQEAREHANILTTFGGSPLGNSRVKLTNVEDCLRRGLIKENQNPLAVAAEQLSKDKIDVLHTIGGDDTNTTAADLAAYLKNHNYDLTVVGLPKTIDNDIIPIHQSLGAWTAAEQGALFFENIVSENSANPRMLIIHEVMGRNCGWLSAETATIYREKLLKKSFLPSMDAHQIRRDVHAVYVPEMSVNLESETTRLKKIMDEFDCVNLFISEGAGVETIVKELESRGETVIRDAFGHVKLDTINPGQWFGKQYKKLLDAQKLLVQKSGYFSRSAASNAQDLDLIEQCCTKAIESALRGESGVIGHDEDQEFQLRAIEFSRIKGGKPFDIDSPWFNDLLHAIGQEKGQKLETSH